MTSAKWRKQMTKVNVAGQPEVAAAYNRMNKRAGAGKGDLPRSCFSEAFRRGYDRIFRRQQHRRTT